MIKMGRIAIKNRVKSFNIDVHKYNMLFSSFKIEVSYTDSNLKQSDNKLIQHEMVGSKVTIPIGVTESTHQPYVYLKFIMIEDEEVHEEEDSMDKYLKVTINFGFNNFNKSIKETSIKKAKNQNRSMQGLDDDEEEYQDKIQIDGTIDTSFRPEGVPSSHEIQQILDMKN